MEKFDPNAAATEDSGIFGLPFEEKDASIVLIPVPWEVTTSYGGGTSRGPSAILAASKQVDLFDLDVLQPYQEGIALLPESAQVNEWNQEGKELAQKIIDVGGRIDGSPALKSSLDRVNVLGQQLNQYVFAETMRLLNDGKLVGVIGGDHSVPYGAIQAIAKKHKRFGILHFDAHSDTRKAYEGFEWSHASIMNNVLTSVPEVQRLVQIGIRDVCEEEIDFIAPQGSRMTVFFDRDLKNARFEGISWAQTCRQIVAALPDEVWISFDIDGLDPVFCPNTGTPVPGGLDFAEANYLIGQLVKSGKRIIGFDLNEVSPSANGDDEWDANVGARLLYKLSAWSLASQGKARLNCD